MVARLWHPHIVGVHDRGEYDGQLWITMDFVEGTDAARLLAERQGGGLPPEDVVRIVSGVADALDYAHQQELLHRDVKPSNILLAQSNPKFSRALLADFGIARMVKDTAGLTATDMTVGTVAYAAPEQLMGHALDGRADQYALAASAFHLLTGQQLFQHDNPAVVISNHLTASPPAIGDRIPELSGLGPAFERALAKSPADRFDSCTDFAEAMAHGLSAAAQGLGATDATVAASGRAAERKAREEGCAGIAPVAAGVVGGGDSRGAGRRGDRDRPGHREQRRAECAASAGPADGQYPGRPGGADRCGLRPPRRCRRRDERAAGVLLAIGHQYSTLVGLSGHRAESASDGRARPYRRGVSGGHRGTGAGLRESNGEDPAECREDVREGNLTGPA